MFIDAVLGTMFIYLHDTIEFVGSRKNTSDTFGGNLVFQSTLNPEKFSSFSSNECRESKLK